MLLFPNTECKVTLTEKGSYCRFAVVAIVLVWCLVCLFFFFSITKSYNTQKQAEFYETYVKVMRVHVALSFIVMLKQSLLHWCRAPSLLAAG